MDTMETKSKEKSMVQTCLAVWSEFVQKEKEEALKSIEQIKKERREAKRHKESREKEDKKAATQNKRTNKKRKVETAKEKSQIAETTDKDAKDKNKKDTKKNEKTEKNEKDTGARQRANRRAQKTNANKKTAQADTAKKTQRSVQKNTEKKNEEKNEMKNENKSTENSTEKKQKQARQRKKVTKTANTAEIGKNTVHMDASSIQKYKEKKGTEAHKEERSSVVFRCETNKNTVQSGSAMRRSIDAIQKEIATKQKQKSRTKTEKKAVPAVVEHTSSANTQTAPHKTTEAQSEAEKNEKTSTNQDIDKTSKSSHLSVCHTVEESKIEEEHKTKQSFDRILPIKEELKNNMRVMQGSEDKIKKHKEQTESSKAKNKDKAAENEKKAVQSTAVGTECTQSIPAQTTEETKQEHSKNKRNTKKEEIKQKRTDKPNQSFAGLKPEELKEKNAELNKLLMSMKINTAKSKENKADVHTEHVKKTHTQGTDKHTHTSTTPEHAKAQDVQKDVQVHTPALPTFSLVIASSDEDVRDPRFEKKQWVDSPSLPRKIMMQNENEADKIFGQSGNTKVNLKEMFSGLTNIPPDSPNRFAD